jgi:hypothetical protein
VKSLQWVSSYLVVDCATESIDLAMLEEKVVALSDVDVTW